MIDSARSASPRLESFNALHDPRTIRLRCRAICDAVLDGRSALYRIDLDRLDAVAERVARLTRTRFPDLQIPFHSRWRHFEAGGVNRKAELDERLAGRSTAEVARAHIDLTVVSVLLDAGAGAQWRYTDTDGRSYVRSEGLGVASLRAFMAGRFSAIESEPLRVDGAALARLDAATLREIFQVTADNPMVGLEGRAGLLARLGKALTAAPATSPLPPRPGQIYDRLMADGAASAGSSVSASDVLGMVLTLTEGVFTAGPVIMGRPAGDMWLHRWAGSEVPGGRIDPVTTGIVPFHKLSQWLSYSLLEPLQWAGLTVSGIDALTGLPEYRNGGLLLDGGVIVPRHAALLQRSHKPADEPVVEWRALTVALLDELAERVRTRLGRSAEELPLACILEGGTWAAGREIAAELREGGVPPLRIESDGTVF